MIFSPQTTARLRNFRRIRRAWWSLIALIGVFVFCMAADWVCPCDPKAVVDVSKLEKYRKNVVERAYDIRAARFNLLAGGEIADYEGPPEILSNMLACASGPLAAPLEGYRIKKPPAPATPASFLNRWNRQKRLKPCCRRRRFHFRLGLASNILSVSMPVDATYSPGWCTVCA
jgi:hypothetical protein